MKEGEGRKCTDSLFSKSQAHERDCGSEGVAVRVEAAHIEAPLLEFP